MENPRGGGGGGGGGGIVIQDMLTKGSGKHVLRSPNGGRKDHLRCRGGPERWVYGWYWPQGGGVRSSTYC